MADNHSYIKCEDFDTLDEAISFKERVDNQYQNKIYTIEIENGFIQGLGKIFKFYPEIEEPI